MTKGQEIKSKIANDIMSLSKEAMSNLNGLIQRYEKIDDSFDGIKLSKNYTLLNQDENILLYGGKYSGKSFCCIEKIVCEALGYGRSSVFVLNRNSLLKTRAFDVVKEYCLVNGVDCEFAYNNIRREIVFSNGAKIKFRIAEAYTYDKEMFFYEYIFIDAIEQISEKNLKDLIRKTPCNKILATISDLRVQISQYHLDLFPIKIRLTIENNEFATELDYKMLECYKNADSKRYQEVRYGISELWK